MGNDAAINGAGEVLGDTTNDNTVCVGSSTTVDLAVGEDRKL